MHTRLAIGLVPVVLAIVGCAAAPTPAAPEVPASLRPPAGQVVYLEALATGMQIYDCAPKIGQPDVFEWAFRSPEATLVDRAGTALGRHYAGPTWEAPDGSKVVGNPVGRDAGPTPTAIPWLLLSNKSNAGAGTMSRALSIQRVQTVGGIAPTTPCGAANAKAVARVPYTATYYFWRAA